MRKGNSRDRYPPRINLSFKSKFILSDGETIPNKLKSLKNWKYPSNKAIIKVIKKKIVKFLSSLLFSSNKYHTAIENNTNLK